MSVTGPPERYARVAVGLAGLALLVSVAFACGGPSPRAAKASAAEVAGITSAFNQWWLLPANCGGTMERASLRVDLVAGVQWALADFAPPSNCSVRVTHSHPVATVPVSGVLPWGAPPAFARGVFERKSGARWAMNESGGTPFPCPAPRGLRPGPGNGALPPQALAVWHLRYAKDCANVSYAEEPPVLQ